jgi:hypothetical protein
MLLMNKTKTRLEVKRFQDIPNVGKAIEKSFITLGFTQPVQLAGKDPYQLYEDLCTVTHTRVDPCVMDIFISAVRYMEGEAPKKWWEYTAERKKNTRSN